VNKMSDLLKVIKTINEVILAEKCTAREVMYLAKEMEINAMTSLLTIQKKLMEQNNKPVKPKKKP